jgi:hypothetical protein
VPLLLIAIVALSHGHLFWLAIPFVFFLFVRPMGWRAGGRTCGRRYPATGSRSPSTIV